jgi:thiosulfate reductase/polysulfide reductase chain A
MCTASCSIRLELEDNKVQWVEDNLHLLGGALCAKGSAGPTFVEDKERLSKPFLEGLMPENSLRSARNMKRR